MVEGADVLEELGRHVVVGPGGLRGGWELDACVSPNQLQDVIGILGQGLVLAHHVVVDDAGVAEGVHPLPVFIERLFVLRPWV